MVEQRQTKPSPIARIIGQVSRGFRRRNPVEATARDVNDTNWNPSVSSKESTPSSFRKAINRLSFSKKHRIDKELMELQGVQNNESTQWISSPRPALSENDLRNVTIRRGTDIQTTPLAGATQFMSEDNLASASCGTPVTSENRVPSYMKISYALNGYRSPVVSSNENTPIRPVGKSLVERRLAQLHNPPANTSQRTFVEDSPMGATCSSPSVKNLIGQFDKWKLCIDSHDNDVKENVKPFTVTSEPGSCRGNTASNNLNSSFASTSMDKNIENSDNDISDISSIVPARSGSKFKETLVSTRVLLEDRCKLALQDLANQIPNIPEQAADSIRMASGKANLLINKKLAKFGELVDSNLNPEVNDKITTTEDLEGYWALVELELVDINKCFTDVEKWRSNHYVNDTFNAEQQQANAKSEKNNNNLKKPRNVKGTLEPKPITEKQKIANEQRKKAIAELRAKTKLNKDNDTDTIM